MTFSGTDSLRNDVKVKLRYMVGGVGSGLEKQIWILRDSGRLNNGPQYVYILIP